MNIQDPHNRARQTGDRGEESQGRFAFPFFTIETVARVDATTIMVGNDNNLPFSAGRFLHRPDDSEFIRLEVAELLDARWESALRPLTRRLLPRGPRIRTSLLLPCR